jgi:hypothetical protein
MLTSSAIRYGLTSGSYKQERIGLTGLASRILSPSSVEDKHHAELEAVLKPPLFRAIHDLFKGKKIPDGVFFENTLVREIGVLREHAALCAKLFVANMDRVGLIRTASTGKWLSTEAAPPALPPNESSNAGLDEGVTTASTPQFEGTKNNGEDPSEPRLPPSANAIFIGHGTNKTPLEQLKKILDHYRIPYKVVIDEPNQFRPISEKVAQVMRQCGAAILIFTADEEFRDAKGEAIWRPSENVVHELGASSFLYEGRIIIFKEDIVKLPTNYSGIGYISFPKDDLMSKAHDLFRELVSFGLVRITVGG